MTPFFRLRPSSAEKEGKSASMTDCFKRKVRRANPHPNPVLDYWQLGIFSLVPFCSAKNPLVSNSFAGRARSSALQTRLRTCQNPRLGFTSRSQSFAFCALHKPAEINFIKKFLTSKFFFVWCLILIHKFMSEKGWLQ